MLITEVKLENIKNHAQAEYKFEPGVTAICGPNGSGKTSIIEAIAWALFDHLDYNRDDFVRRGQKRGQVSISFISNADNREYTVTRDTAGGYSVYDVENKVRLVEQKKDVISWLKQQIGVEPNTDLPTLFKTTIGVPQGTFTADFLQSAANRKKTFDQILKVEEYRQASDNLRATNKHLDARSLEIEKKLSEAEGELKAYDETRQRFETTQSQLEIFEAEQRTVLTARTQIEQKVLEFGALLESIKLQKGLVERAQIKLDLTRGNLSSAKESATQARQAADIVASSASGYAQYVSASQRFSELDQQRVIRDALRSQATKAEHELITAKAQIESATSRLREAEQSAEELASLLPKAEEQRTLEQRISELRESRGEASGLSKAVGVLDNELRKLRERYQELQTQIKAIEQYQELAEHAHAIEEESQTITQKLAQLRAEVARDKEMITALASGGICPLISEKCLNLKQGETLDTRFQSGLQIRHTEISTLEKSLLENTATLKKSREAQRLFSQAEVLQRELDALGEEGKVKKTEQDELTKKLEIIGDSETLLQETENRIAALGNPRARVNALEQTIQRTAEWQESVAKSEAQAATISAQLDQLNLELQAFASLEKILTETTALRIASEAAYQAYIANEKIADTVTARESEALAMAEELTNIESSLNAVTAQQVALEEKYQAGEHQEVVLQFNSLRERSTQLATQLEHARDQFSKLEIQLNYLTAVRERRAESLAAQAKLAELKTTTEFIRDTLQKAAPFITEAYLVSISIEANQLYREITGSFDCTLKWSNDYEINLEERGYHRPFSNLSGGEQMAAALAVRLALLREFSNHLGLAFFDEPTTNMDEDRRKNLAQQIGRITGFKQLFIISHDDSFENFTDQVLNLGGHHE